MDYVNHEEFEGRKQIVDERFERDMERLKDMDKNQRVTTELLSKIAGIVDSIVSKEGDHENRLRELEQKSSKKLDSIWMIVAGAVIGAVIGAVAKNLL